MPEILFSARSILAALTYRSGWRDGHLARLTTIEPSAPAISPIEIVRLNCR